MDTIKEYWTVAMGFVGLIAWAVRLEAGMKANAKDIRSMWEQRKEDLEAARTGRTETNAILHKLDAKLDAAFSEVRGDIKELLKRDAR